MNKANVNKLGLNIGDQVSLQIEKDKSEYDMQMPESFQMLLDQDDEGNRYFHKLTQGSSLIYIVGKVKNIDSQLNKGLAILHHLKETHGKINKKSLWQPLKNLTMELSSNSLYPMAKERLYKIFIFLT